MGLKFVVGDLQQKWLLSAWIKRQDKTENDHD